MSKSASASAVPTIERLSLGSAAASPGTRPSHALPNLVAPASASAGDGSYTGSSASLITPDVLALATPPVHQVDAQALHTLATEMVATLIHSSRFVARKQALAREELQLAGINLPTPSRSATAPITTTVASSQPSAAAAHTEVVRQVSGVESAETLGEIESMLTARLESIGYNVGYHMAENLARDRARFSDTLDVLKFVCKEVWTAVWGKQVDNLRTNHRGVYVLHDNHFQPLRHVSTPHGTHVTAREARVYLAYPVGIVKGALAQLDVPSAVVAESNQAPQCTFHVKTQKMAQSAPPPQPQPGAPPAQRA